MAEWYYIESGQTRGPVDDEAIRVRASVGRLTSASQLMLAGTSQWSTLGAYEAQIGLQHTATGGYGPRGHRLLRHRPASRRRLPATELRLAGYGAPPPGYRHVQRDGATSGPVTAFGRTASHWWKRAVAVIIDTIVLTIPLSIVSSIVGGIETTTVDGEAHVEMRGPGFLITIVAVVLYYALLNGGARGQTVGKMLIRVQVHDIETGGPIGFGRGLGRQLILYVFAIACVLPLLLDYLSPLWDQKRQAWHDKLVRSVVVDVDS